MPRNRHLTRTVSAVIGGSGAALILGLPAVAAPPSANGHSPFVRGEAAITRLGDSLPAVARANGMTPAALRAEILADPTVGVDPNLGLAYTDPLAPGETATPSSSTTVSEAPPTTGPQFQLASLPGADKTIYLDFDGHVTEGTAWNTSFGLTSIVSPPYDLDGSPDTWSSTELQRIAAAWRAIAEDFAPFNVNVTTIEPGPEALRRSDSSDTQYGVRVLFTRDTFANCGCGGHAYVGSFDSSKDVPALVYNSSLRGISEAGSHEAGHTLGLSHDGLSSGTTYYRGHGTGTTSWAPIMGASYTPNVTTWSIQDFTDSNNNDANANYGAGPDDVAVITSMSNGNNFGYRADDHGNDAATSTTLTGPVATASGIIESRGDQDAFSFTGGGAVSISVGIEPVTVGNLDVAMTIANSAGTVVATSDDPAVLTAAWSGNLPTDTYTVTLDGTGTGNPLASPPIGYSDYGSLGQYTLTASFEPGTVTDTTPPAAPTGLSATVTGSSVDLSWAPNTEPDLSSYRVSRASSPSGPFTVVTNTSAGTTSAVDSAPQIGTNVYVVTALDASGNESAASQSATATITATPTSVATGETAVAGTVSGSYADTTVADGVSQSITEVDSGGKPNSRYDTLEHRWTIPATTGVQSLSIVASSTDAGDADSGFRVDWSTNGTTWTPLTTFSGSLNDTFPIGVPTGSVLVRVVDTDSTAGQRTHDTVAVDLLKITGGPEVTPTMAVVSAFTVGELSAGRGSAYGTVSVSVQNDLGQPVAGASVDITLSGSFTGSVTLMTNANGDASYTTATAERKPSFSVCLTDVRASGLSYTAGTVCRAG